MADGSGYARYREYQHATDRLAAAASTAPTTEIGTPFDFWNPMLPGTQALYNLAAAEDLEHVPELMHPMSVVTYRNMRNDGQLDGLYRGTVMPILRYRWMIDPNGCEPRRVQGLAADLGLPVKGQDPGPIARYKRRFQFRKHLQDALRTLYYGHYCFEIVGDTTDPFDTTSKNPAKWHIRKLAARPPHTIDALELADDGGLVVIKQLGQTRDLPVDRIVWYSWDQEGANWWGRSWFRACYRNWLIKDRLLRVDAVKHERNGMGVPVAKGAQGYTSDDLKKLSAVAQSYRAGENAGGAIPFGTDLKLMGVSGNIPDTMASVQYHNEEMSRSWVSMLFDLGSSKTGSRALGQEFHYILDLSQDSVAGWFRDIFNEHVVEDYWDWNYGPEEEYTPRLVYEHDDDPRVASADLALMIQNDVIQPDEQLERAVREAMHLPDKDPKTVRIVKGTDLPSDNTDPQPPMPEGQPPNLPGQEKPTPVKAVEAGAVSPAPSPATWVGRPHPEVLEDNDEER
jgi:hypothetical protein